LNQIGLKLGVAFGVLIAIVIGVGFLGLVRMSHMNADTQEVTDVRWAKVKLAFEALHYSELNNRLTMEVFLLEDQQQIARLLEQRTGNSDRISAILEQIQPQVSGDEERASLDKVAATRKPYIASYLNALDLLITQDKPKEARNLMVNVVLANLLAYHNAWEEFVAYEGRQMDAGGDAVEIRYWSARRQVAVLIAIAVLLAGLIASIVTRRLTIETANRQRAERDLRKAREVLEVRVRERTAQLQRAHEQLQESSVDLQQAATHDRLTGLPNRTLFNDRLTQALEMSRCRPDFRMAVLFIDFDRFKWVNDSLGHESGDLLLKAIGVRLKGLLRRTDTVAPHAQLQTMTARLGGDEFCVLLLGLRTDDEAAAVADRILKALAKPYDILGHEVHSTASIGIAVGSRDYAQAQEMIRDADTAMYCAKASGKGRFVLFNKAMHEQAMRRLTIESELRRAVERGELRPYFQPIVRLDTGEMTCAEALVRWQHPERGLILPGEFIAIAEENGFINVLGLAMLEATCLQFRDWKARVPGLDLSVSVNVSNKQLATGEFHAQVESILRATNMDPRALILEITETALVEATEVTARNLREIRNKGIRVYLDDFGTGYSSLSVLNEFHLDGLKIDRSFIKEAGGLRQFAAILHAINDLAHNLRIKVVAEGVETTDQLALLQTLNCEFGQGYLFSRPLSAEDFEALLLDRSIILSKIQTAA
jgi:diguanylate cyclase (GGDEF)-like protein